MPCSKPKFKHRPELDKHAGEVFEVYEMVKPKLLEWIENELMYKIDWKALDTFMLNEPPKTIPKQSAIVDKGPDFGPYAGIKKMLVSLYNVNGMNQEVFDALQSQFIDQMEEHDSESKTEFTKRTIELFHLIASRSRLQLIEEIQFRQFQ